MEGGKSIADNRGLNGKPPWRIGGDEEGMRRRKRRRGAVHLSSSSPSTSLARSLTACTSSCTQGLDMVDMMRMSMVRTGAEGG